MPPQNFVAILVTSDSFTLSWTLLPGLEPDGLQIGYVIQCNPGDYMLMVSQTIHTCTSTCTCNVICTIVYIVYLCG